MSWRLVNSGLQSPAYTTACDEAILLSRNRSLVPNTLHLYRRSSPTVSLGYFEIVEDCVGLKAAGEHGVQIVRRMSGGSAIYTDPNQLIYSLIVNKELVPDNRNETFSLVCGGVMRALASFGISTEFKPINDILINKKKISGSAQLRRWNTVVQHGTVIIKGDFEKMFQVLKPRPGKARTGSEMTSLFDELGYAPSFPAIEYALSSGFVEVFGVEIHEGSLTIQEKLDIERLITEKYANDAYTYNR